MDPVDSEIHCTVNRDGNVVAIVMHHLNKGIGITDAHVYIDIRAIPRSYSISLEVVIWDEREKMKWEYLRSTNFPKCYYHNEGPMVKIMLLL